MSYDNPEYTSHTFQLTANQADLARTIKGPYGKRGKLVDIAFTPHTTITVGTLTINVGTESNADAHGTLVVSASTTIGTVKTASAHGTIVAQKDATDAVIAANADVEISMATAADTDDFPGDATFTFKWW